MRIAANRTNIAQAILDEPDPYRGAFYRTLLGEVDDPTGGDRRIDRQIVAFDPAGSSLVELNGDLATAKSVAVLVPGMNTTIEGSAANTATARRFVAAGRGDVAVLTYLGGPFPRGNLVSGVVDAASPRYALDMAPRLVAFSEDVDRTVDTQAATAPQERPWGHLHRPFLRRFDPRHRRSHGSYRGPDDVRRGSGCRRRRRRSG